MKQKFVLYFATISWLLSASGHTTIDKWSGPNDKSTNNRDSVELICKPSDYDMHDRQFDVSIALPSYSISSWQNNGLTGTNAVLDRNHQNNILLEDTLCKVSGFAIKPSNSEMMRFSCSLLAQQATNTTVRKDVDLILVDKTTGKCLGGETFTVICDPRPAINATIETVQRFSSYTLQASEIDEDATYEWYDSDGVLVGTGRTVTVSPSTDETYTVRVKANSDGAVSYSEVSVPGMRRIDEVLVSEDNINVKLNAQVQGEAQMVLSSSTNNIPVSSYAVPEGESGCTIPASGLSSGVYQVTLKSDGKTLDSRKISIKK